MIAVDPTRRRGGGALLGDRIRMNSLDGDRVFFRSLATRGAHELPEHLADVIDVREGRRLRPGDRRDARHRPGRRGDRAVRRHLAVRDDAGVRRRLAAGEDRHARLRRHRGDQQVRAARRQGRPARRRPPAGPQPRGVRQAARGHAGLRHLGRDLQRRRRHRALPAPRAACSPSTGSASTRAPCRAVDVRHSSGIRQVVPADRVRYLAEITETVRGYHARDRAAGRGGPPRAAPRAGRGRAGRRRTDATTGVEALLDDARRELPARASPTRSTPGPRSSRPTPATSRS